MENRDEQKNTIPSHLCNVMCYAATALRKNKRG